MQTNYFTEKKKNSLTKRKSAMSDFHQRTFNLGFTVNVGAKLMFYIEGWGWD